jgi:hypothetical protein
MLKEIIHKGKNERNSSSVDGTTSKLVTNVSNTDLKDVSFEEGKTNNVSKILASDNVDDYTDRTLDEKKLKALRRKQLEASRLERERKKKEALHKKEEKKEAERNQKQLLGKAAKHHTDAYKRQL